MNYDYYIKSPCKINLHLDVHHKRYDGFHDLSSIFQLVSLYDEIFVKTNKTGEINIIGDFDCSIENNLIYKGAKMFLDRSKINDGLDILVIKKIPQGGGIGGGSSNCAAILRILSYIYSNTLNKKELNDIALYLGSDVPFFLGTGTSFVNGRGELLTPLKTIQGYYIVLINPSIHISTKEAFNILTKLNIKSELNKENDQKIIEEYNKGLNYFNIFKNSFEIALESDYTFIEIIRKILLDEGAVYAALSGSGSTMFGIFSAKESALKAIKKLSKSCNYKINLVKPIEAFPKTEILPKV